MKKVGDIFGLLADVGTLVLVIFVDVLELLQGFDDVDVVTEEKDDVLGAGQETIIEDGQSLGEL